MKSIYKYVLLLLVPCMVGAMLLSCSNDEIGKPSISYIRVTDPAASDSLLTAGFQGGTVAIIGQNLQNVQQIWVNDQKALLIATMITNTSVIFTVPAQVPTVITDKLYLVFPNNDTLKYDFHLQISKPIISSMQCEYVNAGDVATIIGNYFYAPLTVQFTGGAMGEIVSVDEKAIKVTVPDGAEVGPVTVTTNFGKDVSSFYFRDDRNMILNYDNLTSTGSWRPGLFSSDGGITGNYLLLKGMVTTNARVEDYPNGCLESQLWGQGNGRPEGNFFTGDPSKLSMKFEANVVDWYGSYLNICFGPWNNAGNQEIWSNLNARAIWGPWDAADAELKNTGWITVTIPMTDFKYQMGTSGGNITYTSMNFDPTIAGTLSFWVLGSPKAASTPGSPVEVHIDNVRIVPN
ncbi:MAG TPA: glycan-binding surface protein [Cyclobacteriaceae bacterium]